MKSKKGNRRAPSGTKRGGGAAGGAGFTSVSGAEHVMTVPASVRAAEVRERLTVSTVWDISSFSGVSRYSTARNPAGAIRWASFASLYDEFRVNGMSVTIGFPLTAEPVPVAGAVPRVVAATYDNDSTAPPAALGDYLERSHVALAEPRGLQKFVYRLPKAMMSTSGVGTAIISSEWCDISIPSSVMGIVSFCLDSLFQSAVTAVNISVNTEWDVSFRNRI